MTTTYCAAGDVDSVLTAAGVDRRVDDDEDDTVDSSEELFVTRAIEQAAVFYLNPYLQTRYRLSELASNAWCKWANAWLAAYILDTRGGNAPADVFVEKRREISEQLVAIQSGIIGLPEQAESFDTLPSVTNFEPELRAIRSKVRVLPEISTRPPGDGVKRQTTLEPVW